MPGHLEAMRRFAERIWPLPWGWDPRYLLGAPLGVLYPPFFHWLGGGIGKVLGAEWALKLLVIGSVVALPPCLAASCRGLGLRRREAGIAAAAGLAVLWLPGLGLGGTLRQTLVAGNVANGFALPLYLIVLATVRRGLGRPRSWPLPAMFLALCLLSHFLVGAVAGLTVAAFAAGSRRYGRGAVLAGSGLLAAAPFLAPFARHFKGGSRDVISYAPLPGVAEWVALGVFVALVTLAPSGRARRVLLPPAVLLALLYLLRALLPFVGEPPFRMEWHRFRLLLYLALVPAAVLAARRLPGGIRRGLGAASVAAPLALIALFPYPAAGPSPLPLPDRLPDLAGTRVLVLASPTSQNGSWHGLQTRLPALLNAEGAKGVFVEASPSSRAVFEIERIASGPGMQPRWWAIRIDPSREGTMSAERGAGLLRGLGIGAIAAAEPVAAWVAAMDPRPEALDARLTLFRVPGHVPRVANRPFIPDASCFGGLALGLLGWGAIAWGARRARRASFSAPAGGGDRPQGPRA